MSGTGVRPKAGHNVCLFAGLFARSFVGSRVDNTDDQLVAALLLGDKLGRTWPMAWQLG